METRTLPETITAVRRPKTPNSATLVLDVFMDGELFKTMGGARVARAEAIIVTAWTRQLTVEVRGDLAKAQTEAARNARGGTRTHSGWKYEAAPAPSVAIPVQG